MVGSGGGEWTSLITNLIDKLEVGRYVSLLGNLPNEASLIAKSGRFTCEIVPHQRILRGWSSFSCKMLVIFIDGTLIKYPHLKHL